MTWASQTQPAEPLTLPHPCLSHIFPHTSSMESLSFWLLWLKVLESSNLIPFFSLTPRFTSLVLLFQTVPDLMDKYYFMSSRICYRPCSLLLPHLHLFLNPNSQSDSFQTQVTPHDSSSTRPSVASSLHIWSKGQYPVTHSRCQHQKLEVTIHTLVLGEWFPSLTRPQDHLE